MGRKPKKVHVIKDVRFPALEQQCDSLADAARLIKNNINELLTAKEAGIMCGMSKSAFIRLSEDGRAPAGIKLDRLRRWRKQEILDWIEAGCPNSWRWKGATRNPIGKQPTTSNKRRKHDDSA